MTSLFPGRQDPHDKVTFMPQLLFVLVGQNDLCRLSCNTNTTEINPQTPAEYANNVGVALDRLAEELPRTFVALILPPGNLKNARCE